MRLLPLCALLTLLAGPAEAACSVGAASLSLADYGALTPTTGTLTVPVQCERPDDAYRLDLLGPAGTTLGGRASLTLPLRSPHPGSAPLTLLLLDRDTLLGGSVLRGSQTLRFPVQANAGQWSAAAGAYRVSLALVLTGADSDPAIRGPAAPSTARFPSPGPSVLPGVVSPLPGILLPGGRP